MSKITKLFILGKEKMEKELDVFKIIKYQKLFRHLVKDKWFKDKKDLL